MASSHGMYSQFSIAGSHEYQRVHQHEEILTHGLVVVLLLSCVAALLAAHRITNEGFDSPGHTERAGSE